MSHPSAAWQALLAHREALSTTRIDGLFASDPRRGPAFTFRCGGLALDLSKQQLTAETLRLLLALAAEREVAGARERLFSGAVVNVTENRPALHTALRGEEHVHVGASDVLPEIERCRERMRTLATAVREGAWRGAMGEALTHVLAIGIGGSYLGPKLVVEALAPTHPGPAVQFLANVDPTAADDALAGLDPARTLVVVASKTFTTQETMVNARRVRQWMLAGYEKSALPPDSVIARHFIAATANTRAAGDFGIPEANVFPFADWVGGRYSVWSSVGLPIALALGMPAFERFLAGAHAVDLEFRSTPAERNAPLLFALAGIWNRNFLDIPVHVVLPYAQRLASLPGYLQQLEMESNGKRVAADGSPVASPSCPALFGEPGTLGQHAFHQWLHQGTDSVSADFVVVAKPMGSDTEAHRLLLAHAAAQSEALMTGRITDNPHRDCPGNRPSTTIVLPELDAASLGALVALYEHKVFVQGVIWGINSFDQYGVELGKEIAGKIEPALHGDAASLHPATRHLLGLLQ